MQEEAAGWEWRELVAAAERDAFGADGEGSKDGHGTP
jgi:hypothetical protein